MSNAKRAQKKPEKMIGNLGHKKDHLHHNQEAEHEILSEIYEAKKVFNEDLEDMEQQASE